MSLYPPEDLWVWLRRFGEIFCPLKKIVDDRGIWTGGWSVSVRLSVDRITVFYPGQLKVCHKCGVKGHFSSSCPEQKCSLCQKLGHLARDCNIIKCNLCDKVGHPYSWCPDALHNKPELVEEFFCPDREESGLAEVVPGNPSVSVTSESVSVRPSVVSGSEGSGGCWTSVYVGANPSSLAWQKCGWKSADTEGWRLEDPSLLDSEDPIISTNLREEELEEMQNDAGPDVEEEVEVVQNDVGPHVNGEAPERGVQPSLDLQWCRHTLDAIVQNLQRLQECIQDVLRDIERVNHMFSF
ncbi:hypothetical protein AB205_0054780 [Aquarana catesbeiana]|uniref:CCHC-type domain-containing protein n=1 Tax=Aquarana catesbeiana TaxID=8400 RepID=A0A2G9RI08_AQUCT|nr:hypothetical protein AB205_0054780 [Aquarana catesbeiana]